ncbi:MULTISPECIES: YerC/YecD family TrpR-related protein [unclassified Paenibacillus]|uniref:YerC/YecD family TrpR-related protein n=1 Tax=unclassified Paenibacillus TaxID=185978 RepID=UPI0002E66CEC|nr:MULTISPECIES: YerC/YecD family TrpR-related protein [unclassified Paenibacillus]MCM3340497.1 YerC/YecD family TrpR-related protein [Paenibacillus sp. MER TA 81-3]
MHAKRSGDPTIEQLLGVIMKLRNMDECYGFFEDLATPKELQTLSQRLEVAKMLLNGSTYMEIEAETGASTAIISRVKRSLHHGNGSYRLMLSRLEQQ